MMHHSEKHGRFGAKSLPARMLAATNIPLLLICAILVAYGLVVVYSAVAGSADYDFYRQLSGVVGGAVIMAVLWRFDYRNFSQPIAALLVVSVILILSPFLPGIGVAVNGANSWISILGQRLQPAEFAKPVVILYIAALAARYRGRIQSGRTYMMIIGMLLIPCVCIMAQPDLGTGMVLFVIGIVVLFTGGANRKWLILTAVATVIVVVAAIWIDGLLDDALGYDVFIKDYQKNRLLVFINEDIDPTGISYNLRQSKIAIGSGGLLGKGLGNATYSDLGFLPEAQTDFIFCVLAEQFGFLGSVALIACYVCLLFVALYIALNSNNLFGTLVASGIMGMWVFQIFENIGMTCGLMPITGIPLPFVSYGSSFMIVNFICVGMLASVWAHRNK
jgi:rod shape determining protein RodA